MKAEDQQVAIELRSVITELISKHRHIRYRESKITFILKNALGGNSKTAMIAIVSPAVEQAHQTLSILKYAQQVKFIENTAFINVEVADPELAKLKQELAALKDAIAQKDNEADQIRLRLKQLKDRAEKISDE